MRFTLYIESGEFGSYITKFLGNRCCYRHTTLIDSEIKIISRIFAFKMVGKNCHWSYSFSEWIKLIGRNPAMLIEWWLFSIHYYRRMCRVLLGNSRCRGNSWVHIWDRYCHWKMLYRKQLPILHYVFSSLHGATHRLKSSIWPISYLFWFCHLFTWMLQAL